MKKKIISCICMIVLLVFMGAISFPVSAAYYHALPETPKSYFGSYTGGGILDIWDRDGYKPNGSANWINKRSFIVDDITAIIDQQTTTINFTADINYAFTFTTVTGQDTIRFENAIINGAAVNYRRSYLLNTSIADPFRNVNLISEGLNTRIDGTDRLFAFSFFVDKEDAALPSGSSELPADGVYEGKIQAYYTANGYSVDPSNNIPVRYEKRGTDSILTLNGHVVVELFNGRPVPGHRLQYPHLPEDFNIRVNGEEKKGAYAGITFNDDGSCFIFFQEIRSGEEESFSKLFCYTGTLFLNEREFVGVNETVDDVFDPARGYQREHRVIIPEDGYITVDIFADLDGVTWRPDWSFHYLNYQLVRNDPDNYLVLHKSYSEREDNQKWKTSVRYGVTAGDEFSFIVGNDFRNSIQSPVNYSFRINFVQHDSWKTDPNTEYTLAQPITLNRSIYGMIDHAANGDAPNWFVLDIPEDGVEVTVALDWPERPELGIDIDYDKDGDKLLTIIREMGTAGAYAYPATQFTRGDTLTLSQGKHYFFVNLIEIMSDDNGNMYENDIFRFTVSQANPDIAFRAHGFSDGLVYDVTVEGSIPNGYPDGVTSLTYEEILALPVTIHTRNLLNGAVRDMGPSTIEVLKVTTANGKIESIEIRGRAQTNPGTFDRYTVIYTGS